MENKLAIDDIVSNGMAATLLVYASVISADPPSGSGIFSRDEVVVRYTWADPDTGLGEGVD